MRRVLLVARREFLQIAKTKSFWITLLLVPLMFLVMPLFGRLMEPPETSNYFLHDASGRYGAAVEARIDVGARGEEMFEFARYARTWKLKSSDPTVHWDDGERWFSDEEIAAFIAAGGADAALKDAGPLPPEAQPFKAPQKDFVLARLPADVPTDQGAEAFGAAVGRYLIGGKGKPKGYTAAAAAIYIPTDYGAGAPVRIWTSGGQSGLIDRVRRELNQQARISLAQAAGIDDATALKLQTVAAPIALSAPPRGEGRERIALQSALPLGIAYFLLISVFTSGAWLLQGVIEERSNKLLEAVLACVSPGELMYGKLLGIVGIGLSVIVVWGGCIIVGGAFMPSDMTQAILGTVNAPWLLLALGFYFITGYLICATLFLAIGAMSESMTDAQAYLSPISLMLFLPFVLLAQLITNPDAVAAKVLSWIPFYTPFAMMARMGVGVEPWEVIGTSALLIAFVALELYLLGRVFRATLLRSGQPPKLAELGRLMFKPSPK